MPLRIAHVVDSPSYVGGLTRIITETASIHQRTKGAEQIVAFFSKDVKAAEPFLRDVEKAGSTAYHFQNDTPHLIAAMFEFFRLLKQHQIQILCVHDYKSRILGWLPATWLRIPIVGISHIGSGWSQGSSRKDQLYERIDAWMFRRMNHIVCVSQAVANDVIRLGIPASRVSVAYNAIRLDNVDVPADFSWRHRLEAMFPNKPKLIVGSAGLLVPRKGYDILITAASQLLNTGLDIGFVIFGEGDIREQLQKQIDDAGITSSVVLPGFTDQLDRYMPHFDLFVLSSHVEGLPTVLLEAMATRTAIVATRVVGSTELLVDGSTGFLVPPSDPVALAQAMQKVLSDDELRRTMGENGRQRVEEHFTFELQAEKYWELFQRLLRR